MLPDPDATLGSILQASFSYSFFIGCTGGRGETFPLTLGSVTAPGALTHGPWGLGSGQTAQTGPVLAGYAAASSIISRAARAGGACTGSTGTEGGWAKASSGSPAPAATGWNRTTSRRTGTAQSSGWRPGSWAAGYGRSLT